MRNRLNWQSLRAKSRKILPVIEDVTPRDLPGRADASARAARWRQRAADFVELLKPRVVVMVLVATTAGFYLGSPAGPDARTFVQLLIGTALAAGGTLVLNQYLERDLDGRMERTCRRPLPQGRVEPIEALVYGLFLLLAGLTVLLGLHTPLAAAITAVIAGTYLLVYTPMKRRTSLCSILGAVPGALPPVAGWAAARGSLGPEAWILFAIMFLWQVPHTLAIGRLYRDDYARAGICVLPVIDQEGAATGLHAIANCLALLPVALLPSIVGLAGPLYSLASLLLGISFLWAACGLAHRRTLAAARRLLVVSLIYLPAVLVIMALDKAGF